MTYPNWPSQPDLSASPLENCPCGLDANGDPLPGVIPHLVKVARKPDKVCQRCFKGCPNVVWFDYAGSLLCYTCKTMAQEDKRAARAAARRLG